MGLLIGEKEERVEWKKPDLEWEEKKVEQKNEKAMEKDGISNEVWKYKGVEKMGLGNVRESKEKQGLAGRIERELHNLNY